MDEVEVQVMFSSVPPGAGRDSERTQKDQLINRWLRGRCHCKNFVFFDHGVIYLAADLMAAVGFHLFQRGKWILAQKLGDLVERALN